MFGTAGVQDAPRFLFTCCVANAGYNQALLVFPKVRGYAQVHSPANNCH